MNHCCIAEKLWRTNGRSMDQALTESIKTAKPPRGFLAKGGLIKSLCSKAVHGAELPRIHRLDPEEDARCSDFIALRLAVG